MSWGKTVGILNLGQSSHQLWLRQTYITAAIINLLLKKTDISNDKKKILHPHDLACTPFKK